MAVDLVDSFSLVAFGPSGLFFFRQTRFFVGWWPLPASCCNDTGHQDVLASPSPGDQPGIIGKAFFLLPISLTT